MSTQITFMNTFIASSSMERQVRYIYKHYTELQGCLPKLQMRCLQRKKRKEEYLQRKTKPEQLKADL